MIMTALAKVVARTDDGGSIYLNSTDTSSDLIFAHPTLGVQREHFDGPCRKVEGNACVHYESVHVGGSTTITVTDKGLLLHTLGLCSSCMGGDHDFDTWPTCPSGDRKRKQETDNSNAVPLRSKPVALMRRTAQVRQMPRVRRTAQRRVGVTVGRLLQRGPCMH
jgi:hypothetical protein